jgi:hypothetical protein
MGRNSKRKPPHPALRCREMRKYLLVVDVSGNVDASTMRPRFGQVIGTKASTHNTQMKKPQAFARCGHRAQNCSVLKRRCSPGASRLIEVFAGVESEMLFLETEHSACC